MKTKYIAFVLLLALALLAAGCGGGMAANIASNNATANDNTINTGGYDNTVSEEIAPNGNGQNQASVAPQRRIVIMEGVMVVETYDTEEIVWFITDLAERYHGYVIESNLEKRAVQYGDEATYGSVKIRIPAERFNDAIVEIEAQNLGVVNKEISGEDVTDKYIDLQSRLRNLEEAATQLEMIMENATDTEAVLEVYRELVSVNEEAEVIRGQIQYYEEAAAMSSLFVQVYPIIDEPEPTPTPTPKPWSLGPTFEKSTDKLSNSFQDWLEDVVQFFIYGLPMFILRAGPWLVAFYFIGRWVFRWRKGLKSSREENARQPTSDKTEDN